MDEEQNLQEAVAEGYEFSKESEEVLETVADDLPEEDVGEDAV